ncbi:MAG: ATP-binding protein [Burkholderiales bacterium]
MNRVSRIFPASRPAFDSIKTLIEEFCGMANLSSEDRHKLTLIVEELFVNTVTHGHKGDCDAPVSITFEEVGTLVTLVYEDTAPPFNPLSGGTDTDPEALVQARRVGGLGAFLTVQLTRGAEYSFNDGRNRIRLLYSPAQV